jgi:rhamnopyranosyl-N-acetylglucosaminyl-diphospho-decaprenol beta-1,3/1,4-galactofuranosyltransferase
VIAAVVVTWNRRALLARCLEAVLAQVPAPQRVVVIDNASGDGTEAWLRELSARDRRVRAVRAPRNLGGAGGFHLGMRAGLALGAEWLWLMDDDGHPEPNCLATLLARAQRDRLELCGPLVADEADPDHLAFGLRKLWTVAAVMQGARDGLIWSEINPFNGTLISRALVERIGPVDPRFFLWGDELDFQSRALAVGARVATVLDARYRHPHKPGTRVPVLRGLLGEIAVRPPALAHIWWRNLGRLDRAHHGPGRAAKHLLQHGAHLLLRPRPDWRGWWRYARAFRRGYAEAPASGDA